MKINFVEPVMLDPDRLVELCVEMGQDGTEALLNGTLDQLNAGLRELDILYQTQRWQSIGAQAELLSQLASNAGMTTFARVTRHVVDCAAKERIVPLAATLSRLHRISDGTLNSVWELGDMMR
ncbi:MAG: hypothetical protein HKP40_01505 [Litoreibacter sp.]|nr:hypothetical protein [Litoreibacter sp.]